MSQFDFIKDLAKYGLENDQHKLLATLNELIEHSKSTRKINLALQLQSILKDSLRQQRGLTKVGSLEYHNRTDDRELNEFIFEKVTSDYSFENLITTDEIKEELHFFIQEHQAIDLLTSYDLPVSNKVLLHGPSGCGKTLASYVLAGELKKLMVVINLGAIVSSKLGETSKNLAKVFKRASSEESIIFIDEFDSLGKVRDYSQDHGEMKRVVNTILQLFDYMPQSSIVIAATNQVEMIDDALLRRFDLNLRLDLPDEGRIKELISLTLSSSQFSFDKPRRLDAVIKSSRTLSYYSIQKTLRTAIKRSIFKDLKAGVKKLNPTISIDLWSQLIEDEKKALNK